MNTAHNEKANSDDETDYENVPEDWSRRTKVNKSDPKIVIKILSCLVKLNFKCKYTEMNKSDIQKIIQVFKKHKISKYNEEIPIDIKNFHTNMKTWLRVMFMKMGEVGDMNNDIFLEIVSHNSNLTKIAKETLKAKTSTPSTTTQALVRNLKTEKDSTRLEIVAYAAKLLFSELYLLPKPITSVEPIPTNVKKRGRSNLNHRQTQKKKKIAKEKKSDSLLSKIDVRALQLYNTTAPKQIMTAPDIVSLLKFLLHLHSILVLTDSQYEDLSSKFQNAQSIIVLRRNIFIEKLFYNRLLIYSASLSPKDAVEKMNDYFDLLM